MPKSYVLDLNGLDQIVASKAVDVRRHYRQLSVPARVSPPVAHLEHALPPVFTYRDISRILSLITSAGSIFVIGDWL